MTGPAAIPAGPPGPAPIAAPLAPLPGAWQAAASRLSARATRRARVGAALRRAAAGIAFGAVAAAALRVLGVGARELSSIVLVASAAAGVVVGARAARRVRATSVADAAWALDRVGEASGRGLSAALLAGPHARAAEAAGAPPPAIRLLPPAGLAPFVASLLLAVGALSIPTPKPGADDGTPSEADLAAGGDSDSTAIAAARLDAKAADAARKARGERVIRAALGLPTEGPLDAQDVARRLADPAALAAARHAAEPGSPAALALAAANASDPEAAAAVASALTSDAAERAEALRREAATRRAGAGARAGARTLGDQPVIPVTRRDLVARYLDARAESAPAGSTPVPGAPDAPGPR